MSQPIAKVAIFTTDYSAIKFAATDVFLFGPETRGLPQTLLDA